MKSPLRARRVPSILATRISALMAAAALVPASTGLAATSIWTGSIDTLWTNSGNWTGGVPGGATGATNGDTATFNTGAVGTVTVDATRNIKNIFFDTTAGAFTLAGGGLVLTNGGAITLNDNVGASQTISSPITLSTTASSTYSFLNFSNAAGVSLNITGNVSGAAVQTLTLGGVGNGLVSGIVGNGTGTVSLAKTGGGT